MNSGLGQNWLLLRGLARESAHWGDFIPQLQAAFPDATITLLDLPGTGRFYKEVSPRTIKTISETVRRQALENGLPATASNNSGYFAGRHGGLGVDAQLS